MKVLIAGGGIYGATAALALAERGHAVHLFDPGPLPHPAASSTDISKVIRMDYGADDFYMTLMETAMQGWVNWNARFETPLYHPSGVLMMARSPLQPGLFEYESLLRLQARGIAVERLDAAGLKARVPVWDSHSYPDGYYNPLGGWAASGAVVTEVLQWAIAAGVIVHSGNAVQRLTQTDQRINGVILTSGQQHIGDLVIVAAGAWSTKLLPHMADKLWVTGQPVFHLQVDPTAYQPPHFYTWTADISQTGWYGFPALPDGRLKIANHGLGGPVDPDGERVVTAEMEGHLRQFLQGTFPSLSAAPLVYTRLCLYCDSWDGNFYLDHDPDHPGLFVATGGSGHGFKFAPVLGEIVADAVEGRANPAGQCFAWRAAGQPITEDARWQNQA